MKTKMRMSTLSIDICFSHQKKDSKNFVKKQKYFHNFVDLFICSHNLRKQFSIQFTIYQTERSIGSN